MSTMFSPNQPCPLLLPTPNTRISAIVKPAYASLSPSTKRSARVCAERESGRGFSGPRKQEAVPDKPIAAADEEELPPEVTNRIMRRILVFVGVPLGGGLGVLQLFGYLKDNHIWEAPLWLSFITIFLTFGGSALGVPFGALSTSWDLDKKGSLLGLEEASYNWVQMWEEGSD